MVRRKSTKTSFTYKHLNEYLYGSFTCFVSGIPVKLADGSDGLPQHQGGEGDDDQGQRRAELDQALAPQQVRTPQLFADSGQTPPEARGFVLWRQRQELGQVEDERNEKEGDGVVKLTFGIQTGGIGLQRYGCVIFQLGTHGRLQN